MRSTKKTNGNMQTPTEESKREMSAHFRYDEVCHISASGTAQPIDFKLFTKIGNYYVHRGNADAVNLAGYFRKQLKEFGITFYYQTLKSPADIDDICHIVYVTENDFAKWDFKLAGTTSSTNSNTNTSSTRTTSTFSAASIGNDINVNAFQDASTQNFVHKPISTLNEFLSMDFTSNQPPFLPSVSPATETGRTCESPLTQDNQQELPSLSTSRKKFHTRKKYGFENDFQSVSKLEVTPKRTHILKRQFVKMMNSSGKEYYVNRCFAEPNKMASNIRTNNKEIKNLNVTVHFETIKPSAEDKALDADAQDCHIVYLTKDDYERQFLPTLDSMRVNRSHLVSVSSMPPQNPAPQIPAYEQTTSNIFNSTTQTENSMGQYSHNAATNVSRNPYAIFSSKAKPTESAHTLDLQQSITETDQIDKNDPLYQEMLADLMSGLGSDKKNTRSY